MNEFYVLFRWIIYLRTKLIKRGMNTILDGIAILLTRHMLYHAHTGKTCFLYFIICHPPFYRFPVGRCVHKYSKARRVVVSKKKTRHCGVGLGACRRSPTTGRTSDMANKENELTCSSDVQAILYSDNCGFTVNSTETSKMAGAGSKYSDCFTEVS